MVTDTLDGFTVGVTADRRWEEQAELLERRGIAVMHGPAIRTLPIVSDPALREATDALIALPPDVLVVNTAIGLRAWFSFAEANGLDDALRAALEPALVFVRGPKANGAAMAAGLGVSWQAPSETLAELAARLLEDGVIGKRIAFQRDGGATAPAVEQLRAGGAVVIEIPVYRWELPEDIKPAVRLIDAAIDHRLHAVTFTSSPALRNLLDIADAEGTGAELRRALGGPVAAVCVGPVCARTAANAGINVAVTAKRARVGPMVRALVELLHHQVRMVGVDGVDVVLRGAVVEVDGRVAELSGRELDVMDALLERPGAVVSKPDLLASVWDPATDPHLVEVTVGRLRRRLSPVGLSVMAVPRRGYRISAASIPAGRAT